MGTSFLGPQNILVIGFSIVFDEPLLARSRVSLAPVLGYLRMGRDHFSLCPGFMSDSYVRHSEEGALKSITVNSA